MHYAGYCGDRLTSVVYKFLSRLGESSTVDSKPVSFISSKFFCERR